MDYGVRLWLRGESLSAIGINTRGQQNRLGNRTAVLLGVCLISLLVYVTCTAFISDAWALQSFHVGVFTLLGAYLLTGLSRVENKVTVGVDWLIYLIPAWGVIQIITQTTASTFETRMATLRWGALACIFFLARVIGDSRRTRQVLLSAFLLFATVIAVLCLTQLFTSEGRVLWVFSSGYPDVYATFPSYNHYVQFIELALPIALWRAVREGLKSWWYALAGGVLYGSVIGAASRTGAVLCTAEVLYMLSMGLVRYRVREHRLLWRSTAATLIMVPILAALFTTAVGWERVWERFKEHDPYIVRREFLVAALDIAQHHPLAGAGLDTFPAVYQRYAIKDFPFYANHAHNDWMEFAADGGVPFFLLVSIPFAAIIPSAIRNPWGVGLLAVMLHACVDFPFPRTAVSGWIFFMLAMLYAAKKHDQMSHEP